MQTSPLATALHYFAEKTQAFSDIDLGQPYAWKWHDEGVRFAHIGTYQELHDLAITITTRRIANGNPPTSAQQALGIYHAAYRDTQALWLGVSDTLFDQEPKTGEWSLRSVYGHMMGVERNFYGLVHYALRRLRGEPNLSVEYPDGETDRLLGNKAEFDTLIEHGTFAEMRAFAEALHTRTLSEFSGITEAELEAKSLWWEGEELPIVHRLLRFAAHNRQHTLQLEKTLDWLGRTPNEAKRLSRQLYNALAALENATLGAPDSDIDFTAQEQLSATIRHRADDVIDVVTQANALITAIQKHDLDAAKRVIDDNPKLVDTLNPQGVSAVMMATYYGAKAIGDYLIEQGAWLGLHEAAALGNVERATQAIANLPEWVQEYSVDGYTPLQLACFFGHENVARLLIEAGSDVNAVSKNDMRTTPLHAATAGNHTTLVPILIDHNADLTHTQNGGFTVLHSAAQNGNRALVELFLEKGVDRTVTAGDGQTARDFAAQAGHQEIVDLLDE